MMAPCKRQLKTTSHLICGSCSNWVDFVKSGCEKSWAEVQADSFSFECRGCTKMKELEVELEELRLLVVAIVGREQGGCASSSGENVYVQNARLLCWQTKFLHEYVTTIDHLN